MCVNDSACERGAERKWNGADRKRVEREHIDIPENAWTEAERWAEGSGAGANGAESGCHKDRLERWAANRPLTLRSRAPTGLFSLCSHHNSQRDRSRTGNHYFENHSYLDVLRYSRTRHDLLWVHRLWSLKWSWMMKLSDGVLTVQRTPWMFSVWLRCVRVRRTFPT